MNFGFPASYVSRQPVNQPLGHVRDRVKKVALEIGWHLVSDTQEELIFRVPINSSSWGEVVSLNFDGESMSIESRCRWPFQFLDSGKNAENCAKFLKAFERY